VGDGDDDQGDEDPEQLASLDQRADRDAGALDRRAGVPLRRGWPCRAGCDNFLYTLKAGPAGGRLRRPSSAGGGLHMSFPPGEQTSA